MNEDITQQGGQYFHFSPLKKSLRCFGTHLKKQTRSSVQLEAAETVSNMNFSEAKCEVKQLLARVSPSDLPPLLDWIRTSGET